MVSFAGFYPSEAPKYSCVVCIKKSGLPASGGGQAGPVFSEIAQFVMAKGVFRPASAAADSTSVFEAPEPTPIPEVEKGKIPDVQGLGARDAVSLLEQQGLRVKLHGQGKVHSQSLPAGSVAVEGQTITLELKVKSE